MTVRSNERFAYFNGSFLPESRVGVSFRDRGFKYGDAVFDMTRSFGHEIFRLREHIERLYRSLKYVRIDPGITPSEMIRISEEVFERNRHLLSPNGDYWLGQRISRGCDTPDGDVTDHDGPTVIVECTPLPLKKRAHLFRDGIKVIVPSVRRVAPDMLSPNAKSHNYLNLIQADLEVQAQDPEAWAVLLDADGHLCEGLGSNIFLVREGALFTPETRLVLPGISRAMVIELAENCGLPVKEGSLTLFDAYTADEIFLTSTSLGLCGVRQINGSVVGEGKPPGPVTQKLTDEYIGAVNHDFVTQYLQHLDA